MNPLRKWLRYWQPMLRGRFCLRPQDGRFDFVSINAGTALTGGRFWQRTRGGYELYRRDPVRLGKWRWVGRADASATVVRNMPMFPPPADRTSEFRIGVVGAGGVILTDHAVRSLVTIDGAGGLVATAPNPIVGLQVEAAGADAFRLSWIYDEQGQQGKPVAFDLFNDVGSPGVINDGVLVASVPYRLRRGHFSTTISGFAANLRIGWQVRVRGGDEALSGPSEIAYATIHSDVLPADRPIPLRR